MSAEEPDLSWWLVESELDYFRARASRIVGMGDGWDRVLDLARDAEQRPHLTTASDLLELECREMAVLLEQIVREDGHTLTLAACLRAIITDASKRVLETQGSGS